MNTETRPDAKNPLKNVALEPLPRPGGFRLRHLMYAVFYCALVLWIGAVTGLVVISGFLGLILALVCTVVYLFAGRRSAQQDALLWALAVTAERGMPMAPTFDAFAGQCRGKYHRKVRASARHLRQGLSLPEVLACEPGLFPRDAEVLTRMGHECGTLGPALREAAALPARLRGPWTGVAIRIAYLLWVLVVFQSMASFMSYFILPKFEAIFNDFGVPLPAVTTLVIAASHQFIMYFYIIFPIFLLQLGLLGLATVATLGVLPWELPLVGRLFYRQHTALVLRCLAQVVDGNKSMTQEIQTLARTYPAAGIRRRLQWVARDIEMGHDWCGALLARGVIRPAEAALLEAAKRVGNLSWALRQAAENSERRLIYRLQLGAQWLLPLFVLAIGTLVFLMAVAYFTPLLVLIEKLAGR